MRPCPRKAAAFTASASPTPSARPMRSTHCWPGPPMRAARSSCRPRRAAAVGTPATSRISTAIYGRWPPAADLTSLGAVSSLAPPPSSQQKIIDYKVERQVLGRKDYAQEELDQATRAVKQQLAAYKKLVKALTHAGDDPEVA